jgi:hypothetical protein
MKYLRMKANEIGSASTAEMLKIGLNEPPPGGLKVEDIRSRLRVLDAIDKSNGVLALEDADAKVMQACVVAMKWKAVHPDIVTFTEAVANLADTPPEGP